MVPMTVGKGTRGVQGIVVVSSPMWLLVGKDKTMGYVGTVPGNHLGILDDQIPQGQREIQQDSS